MSNGPQVLTGNRGVQQPNQFGGQPQQQPNQAATNQLGQLAAFSARVAGTINNPNSSSSIYTTTTSRNNYSHLLCMEDNAAEEQMKAQALNDGGNFATSIFNICARRLAQNPFYRVLLAAKERFKTASVQNGPVDQNLAEFIAEIDNNSTLYQFVLANASIMFTADFAIASMQGDERLRTDRSVVDQMYYRCAVDSIYMQYYDYLANHPEGAQLLYRLNPKVKDFLLNLEEGQYETVLGKFTYVNVQCPWRKGRLNELTSRSTQANPLLEAYNPMDMGFAGSYFDPNPGMNVPPNASSGDIEMQRFIREQIQRNESQGSVEVRTPHHHNDIIQTTYNDYDKPELNLLDMTRKNMHNYPISNWGAQIPGTEYWIIRPEHVRHYTLIMNMDDGTYYSARDTRELGHIPVYRFNWIDCTFNYRLIKIDLQGDDHMSALISNPEKLLPYMYVEDGVQKTTFDPVVMETSKFMNDGNIIPVGEMKELEKEPDILVGNKPMKANEGNEATINRLNVYTQTFDPKGKLDAFVLPMVITREWQMEPNVNMDRFYSQFKVMVQGGNDRYDDTIQVLRHIRGAMKECESQEFLEFVNPYVTNLVNRWLIECRGYVETKSEVLNSASPCSYMKSSDIFEDLEEWVEWMKENDMATLRAFVDYRFNTFMRTGIEVLCKPEEVKKEYEEKYSKLDDKVYYNAMMKSSEKAVILRRDTVFINLTKQTAPPTTEAVVIKESNNPEIFAIIREAAKITGKHFERKPQVLLKFNTDVGNKVYVVTPSDIDPDSVVTIRTISSGQTYCHPYPVMD